MVHLYHLGRPKVATLVRSMATKRQHLTAPATQLPIEFAGNKVELVREVFEFSIVLHLLVLFKGK